MTPDHIVRAWKDADYSSSLTHSDGESVPPSPIGPMDLADDAIDLTAGGNILGTELLETIGCCKGITQKGLCDFTAGYPICTQLCFTIWLTNGGC
jgi:mersacidin/lichenicidin family type 2 lantibiotic